MKFQDLPPQLASASIESIKFRRDFVVEVMHDIIWNRITRLKQTDPDGRLEDFEGLYKDLQDERDLYDRCIVDSMEDLSSHQ